MGTTMMAIRLLTSIVAGAVSGSGGGLEAQGNTLIAGSKPPQSQRFIAPQPTTGPKPPQQVRVEVRPPIQGEVRAFTPRIVCGMKIFEGSPDLDRGIVKPIPEDHNAKIRVLGPPPCERETVVTPGRR